MCIWFPVKALRTMTLPRSVAGALLLVLLALLVTTCDVFTSPGLKNVQLSYAGDSVLIVGTISVASVQVQAEGEMLHGPRLSLTSSDTTILAFRNDSLVAKQRGTVTLTARMLSAALPASSPTLEQEIRVVVKDVSVQPSEDTLVSLGDTLLLEGTATDVHHRPITDVGFTWVSSDSAVATVNEYGRVLARSNGTAEVSAIADDDTATATIVVQQQLAGMSFDPDAAFFTAFGDHLAVHAVGHDGRGNAMAGMQATWLSRNSAVAAADASGGVTARGNGSTYVLCTSGDVADSLSVTVDQAATQVTISAMQGLAITSIGDHLQLSAVATDSRGNTVTDNAVQWATLDPTIAVVSNVGDVTAINVGDARVMAFLDAAADTATITVSNEPVTIDLVPNSAVLASIDDTLQLHAVVRNGRGDAVTGLAIGWSTPDVAVLDVLPDGRAIAIGTGTARVIGAVGGVADTSTVTVTNAPAFLDITSPDTTLTSLGDAFLPAVAVKNARGADLPRDAVTWISDNSAIGYVSAFGEIVAADTGAARIRATSGALADTLFVTIENVPALVSIESDLDTLTSLGQQLFYGVEVRNARGNLIADYPSRWESSSATTVVVDTGLITAVSVGGSWVRAMADSVGDSVRVEVVEPSLVHVDNSVLTTPQFGTLKRPYTRIQDAVNAVDAGDTVFIHVGSGAYAETIALTRQTVLLGDSTDYINDNRDPLRLPRVAHDTGSAAITAHTTAPQRIWYLSVVHTLDGPAVDAVGSDIDLRWFFVNPPSTTASRIGRGISVEGSLSGTQVHNAFVYRVRGYGMKLLNTSNAQVTDDTVWAVDSIPGVEPGAGIHVVGGERNLVQGNVVRYTQGPQIFLDEAEISEIYNNDLRGANQLIRMVGITKIETRVNNNDLDLSGMPGETTDHAHPPFAIEIRDSPGAIVMSGDTLVQNSGPSMHGIHVRNSGMYTECQSCLLRGMQQAIQLDTTSLSLTGTTIDSVRFGIAANGRTSLTIHDSHLSRMIEAPCLSLWGDSSNVWINNSTFTDCWPDAVTWNDWSAVTLAGAHSRWEIQNSTFQGEQDFAIWFDQAEAGGSAARIRDNLILGRGDGVDIGANAFGAIQGTADTVLIAGNRIRNWRFANGAYSLSGIRIVGGDSVAVDSNLVSNNTFGLWLDPVPSYFQATDNDFYDNDSLAVWHPASALLTAEDNWWGDRRGPRRAAHSWRAP